MKKTVAIIVGVILCLCMIACEKSDTILNVSSDNTSTIKSDVVEFVEKIESKEVDSNKSVNGVTSIENVSSEDASSKVISSQEVISSEDASSESVLQNTPSTEPEWKYLHGGLDHIIKTNGIETHKIYIPEDYPGEYNKFIAESVDESEFGTQTKEKLRDGIVAYDGWIFYGEYDRYYWNDKINPEESYDYVLEESYYKIREDGTQKTMIAFRGAKSSLDPMICDTVGAYGEYLYYVVYDGFEGRSEEIELTLCRISMSSESTDIVADREFIAYLDGITYIGDFRIEGEWIYFASEGNNYKIMIDGTQMQIT